VPSASSQRRCTGRVPNTGVDQASRN
jgi:hypothetical protein